MTELWTTYLSATLRRRLHAGPVSPPDRDRFDACIAFVDISGFSRLSEALAAKHGAEGAELLQVYTNDYLGQLIEEVNRHGGDIIKFAGDAFIALWRAQSATVEKATLSSLVERACECCLSLLGTLDHHAVHSPDGPTGTTLRLHAGVAAGEVSEFVLGRATSEGGHGLEHLIAGSIVARMGEAADAAKAGDVVISACAANVCRQSESTAGIDGNGPLRSWLQDSEQLPGGALRLRASSPRRLPPPAAGQSHAGPDTNFTNPHSLLGAGPSAIPPPIWQDFLPAVLREHTSAQVGGGRALYLSEHRTLSAVFLRLHGLGRCFRPSPQRSRPPYRPTR